MTSNQIPLRVYSTPLPQSTPKMEKRKLRSTSAQIRVLVDHMAMKPSMAISDGSCKGPTARTDMEWIRLKHLLREYGPDKSIEQWKHTWRDLRKRAKLEYAAVMADRPENATEVAISTQSKAVLEAIGFWKNEGGEEATSSTSARPYPDEDNEDHRENGSQLNEEGDPLEDHEEVNDGYGDQEESNQSTENSQERTRLNTTIPVPIKPKKRKYSDPPYSRSPTPLRKRRDDIESMSILDKYLEYEREKERMAHEREMSRIAQNDKVVKMLGRVVAVLESLSPGIKKYLEENSRDSS